MNIYYSDIKNNDFQHFISHPKLISPNNLKYFEKYLNKIFAKFEIETDFEKMF